MPFLQIQNVTSGVIPPGTMIVIDTTSGATFGFARAYDSAIDSLDDVVGVAAQTLYTSGKQNPGNVADGPDYYNLDYYTWSELLTNVVDGDGALIHRNSRGCTC